MTENENKQVDSEKNEEMERVLVEMKTDKNKSSEFAVNLTTGLDPDLEFQVDTEYEPITMTQAKSTEEALSEEPNEEVVIIRGKIKTSEIEKLKSQPDVINVWSDPEITPFKNCAITPCDCDWGTAKGDIQDVAKYLGVDKIWASGYEGNGIVIGIVDSGVQKSKIPGVVGGWPSNWGTISSEGEHGNMTATDALGMAPKSKIYDIRIFGNGNATSNALQGFQWAINQYKANGTPQILSNSWGFTGGGHDAAENPNHPFTRKVVEAINTGILVLFSAGNCGEACPSSSCQSTGPGKSIWGASGHEKVMTVGAANIKEEWIGYSSQGPAALSADKPDFCSISHFKGYHDVDTGTSAACPIAAGVVALLKQAKSSLTQDEAKKALRSTAKDIGPTGFDHHSGAGIINAKAAIGKIATWEKNKTVIGLWTINQNRNAHVYFKGVGWKKISSTNDNIFFNMLSQLTAAKAHGKPVDFYEENGVIKEVYVF